MLLTASRLVNASSSSSCIVLWCRRNRLKWLNEHYCCWKRQTLMKKLMNQDTKCKAVFCYNSKKFKHVMFARCFCGLEVLGSSNSIPNVSASGVVLLKMSSHNIRWFWIMSMRLLRGQFFFYVGRLCNWLVSPTAVIWRSAKQSKISELWLKARMDLYFPAHRVLHQKGKLVTNARRLGQSRKNQLSF